MKNRISHWSLISLSLVLLSCATKTSDADMANQSVPLSKEASVEYDIAFEFYRSGDMVRALGAAIKSVELTPENADSRNLLGLIYFRRGEVDKAEAEFKKAIEINPNLTEAYTNLGSLYYSRENYAEAEATLRKALENPLYLNPERTYNNLGLVLRAMGDEIAAIRAFEQAIALQPQYYLPFQNLGKILVDQGKLQRAQVVFAEAARLCGACSEPHYHLGTVHLKTNDKEKAMAAFKKGFQLDPNSYYGQLCQQYLNEEK